MIHRDHLFTLTLIGILCIGSITVSQTVRNVGAGQTYTTVSSAISAAASGDTINIVDAVITANNLASFKNLVIRGQGANATILQGAASPYTGCGNIIWVPSGYTVTFLDLHLRNGDYAGGGGAICAQGNINANRCYFSENRAGQGGAIYCTGTLNVENSTFYNNLSTNQGAGCFNWGTATITNCTFTQNSSGSWGGALYRYGGTLAITNCTIVSNYAVSGGGGVYGGSSVTLKNTIMSDNTPQNCRYAVTSGGYNIDDSSGCGCTSTGDLQDVDPNLGDLANNGGTTPTMQPQAGWAVNPLSSNGAPTLDQRGFPRQGSTADIGACEAGPGILPVELTNLSASVRNNTVLLAWETATEVNNYGFEVQRNANGTWYTIGFVDGYGTCNSPRRYKYNDTPPRIGNTVSYRLKQIDRDGSFEYSGIVEARFAPERSPLAYLGNYPNPFSAKTHITYTLNENTPVLISVYDIHGRLVRELVNSEQQQGNYSIPFNAGYLPEGVYLIQLRTSHGLEAKRMTVSR